MGVLIHWKIYGLPVSHAITLVEIAFILPKIEGVSTIKLTVDWGGLIYPKLPQSRG
jgi:hypothetical protein